MPNPNPTSHQCDPGSGTRDDGPGPATSVTVQQQQTLTAQSAPNTTDNSNQVWMSSEYSLSKNPLKLLFFYIPQFLWRQWILVTMLWFACAIQVTAALKSAHHKGMFSVFGNGVFSMIMIIPFVLVEVEWQQQQDQSLQRQQNSSQQIQSQSNSYFNFNTFKLKRANLSPLKENFKLTFLVALFSGLNRSLTNASLYFIDAWLKTALLALTVPLTWLMGGLLVNLGIDKRASMIIYCQNYNNDSQDNNSSRWLSSISMIPPLLLISLGGMVTALPSDSDSNQDVKNIISTVTVQNLKTPQSSPGLYLFGIFLQMCSNVAGALQNVFTKVLLSPNSFGLTTSQPTPVSGTVGSPTQQTSPSSDSESASHSIPTKPQIALLTQPLIALFGILSIILFEDSNFSQFPPLSSLILFSFGVTGILVCELRLVELTSALTLSVLAAAHNVIIVVFFLLLDGEGGDISTGQEIGYVINTIGVFGYSGVKYWQRVEDEEIERRDRDLMDVETNGASRTVTGPSGTGIESGNISSGSVSGSGSAIQQSLLENRQI